ncbi:putative Mitochondrial genome maintenance exonuclease 1 [Hypsibius exemplaris]|uniref:Mitochondrial genome maintenance exonuclease 1 n=1 Tax=Hypsibius exemplaris TaxID=2072580 RepID=A0A1W0W9S9_HYPEX|nr:putative Mitochondrial genome maintenance exonuclease 1 [Hypsibius exemplaris]
MPVLPRSVRRALLGSPSFFRAGLRQIRWKTTVPLIEASFEDSPETEHATRVKLRKKASEELYRTTPLNLVPNGPPGQPKTRKANPKAAYFPSEINFDNLSASVYGPRLKTSPEERSRFPAALNSANSPKSAETKRNSAVKLIFGTHVGMPRLESYRSARGREQAALGVVSEMAAEPINEVLQSAFSEPTDDDLIFGPALGSAEASKSPPTPRFDPVEPHGYVVSTPRPATKTSYPKKAAVPKVPIQIVREETTPLEEVRPRASTSVGFQFVELKKEGDLKALPQAPMMNKLRPDYLEEPNSITLPGTVALRICPEALIGQALAPEKYPAVTTVLDVTMPPESRARLDLWKARKITELGVEGFKLYQQNIFADGRGFHTAVETVLHGSPVDKVTVPDRNKGHWESLRGVFKDISDVVSVEERVSHPFLCYKGVSDCVISLDGTPSLVEWKTSSTRKDTAKALYDNPIQVAAYLGAVNFDEAFAGRNVQISHGAVVVAYENGDPASVVRFDYNLMRSYWALWLKRLHQYWRLAAIEKALPKRKE